MNRSALFPIILASLLIPACDDNTSQSAGTSATPTEPPQSSDQAAEIGEKCGADIQCNSDLECRDHRCVQIATTGQNCDDTHVCGKPLECIDKTCQNPQSGAGQTCKEDADCKSPLKCHNDHCLNEIEIGNPCDNASYCADSNCDDDGICRHYALEGEECDDESRRCQNDMICDFGICHIPGELGENCSDTVSCKSPYVCEYASGKCMTAGALGDDCGNDLMVLCDESTGLSCIDNKCRKPVSGNTECSDMNPCADADAVCYNGKCMTKLECTGDSECQADTYCCMEDGCEHKNICVPYGTGPRPSTNDACLYKTVPGLFEADIQCEWTRPAEGDPYPSSFNIVTPVFVARTPHDLGGANALIVGTYARGNVTNAAGTNIDEAYGNTTVIRILNPETCEIVENIRDEENLVSAGATMAIGDVDGDGHAEIFAQRSIYQTKNNKYGGIIAYKWSDNDNKYVKSWTAYDELKVKNYGWGGLALHDINDDGKPEVINPAGEVLDALTGKKLNGDQSFKTTLFAVVDDLDNDKKIEFLDYDGNVYEWTIEKEADGTIKSQKWVMEYPVNAAQKGHVLKAIGDFGTPGATAGEFNWEKPDGIAEIVSTRGIEAGKGTAQISIHTLTKNTDNGIETKGQQRILFIDKLYGGGAPTIGDFDGDTLPEVGVAFGDFYTVFDPRCQKDTEGKLPDGCKEEFILWKQANVDNSSYTTGSSVFDFDADGQIEVVYADECYTRIYDGKTGDVLFSAKHSSRTAYEMPIIADVDNDESAEIIMGANTQDRTCPTLDTIHRGIRCQNNADCTSNVCEDGFCRCTENSECNWRKGADGQIKTEYICTDPMASDKAVNSKKVCRAQRPQSQTISGFRVMRDRYDRWASSRNLWNQFGYSITNINDDLTIPQTSKWTPNFLTSGLNNYRANAQGKIGMNAAPDITGKLDKENLCVKGKDDKITLHGVVCNRGTKMVASKMPASFYLVEEDGKLGKKYCTAYTTENVPVGGCLEVTCTLDEIQEGSTVRMITNDDGNGGRTTVECNEDNNTDEVLLDKCQVAVN